MDFEKYCIEILEPMLNEKNRRIKELECKILQTREKAIDEIENIFDYDYFLKYSNDDRLISFNNLSLMIKDMLEQLKQNIK